MCGFTQHKGVRVRDCEWGSIMGEWNLISRCPWRLRSHLILGRWMKYYFPRRARHHNCVCTSAQSRWSPAFISSPKIPTCPISTAVPGGNLTVGSFVISNYYLITSLVITREIFAYSQPESQNPLKSDVFFSFCKVTRPRSRTAVWFQSGWHQLVPDCMNDWWEWVPPPLLQQSGVTGNHSLVTEGGGDRQTKPDT